jgi:hypothetical protein
VSDISGGLGRSGELDLREGEIREDYIKEKIVGVVGGDN